MDVYGYCFLADAMSREKTQALADKLMATGGGTSMFNSGEEFTELYSHPWVHELGRRSHRSAAFHQSVTKNGWILEDLG